MKMDHGVMGSLLLVVLLLVSTGVQSLSPQSPPTPTEGISWSVPWEDELCCESPGATFTVEDDTTAAEQRRNESGLPLFTQCNFRSQRHLHQPIQSSGAALCVDVLCRITDDWTALTCDLDPDHLASNSTPTAAMSLKLLRSDSERMNSSDDYVSCEGNVSLSCSLDLGTAFTSTDIILNISIAQVAAAPVYLKVPPTPVKPSAPVNVSHHQTIEAELVLNWENPSEESRSLRHEVRYSSDTTSKVLSVLGEPRLLLDLEANVNFSIQIRSSSLADPPLWSSWSEPHHIHLDSVSYLPEKVKVRPGEAVTIHCVFNDHEFNASSAQWILNYEETLDSSHFQTVNQWVSRVTVRPSETTMYDILLCSQDNPLLYSQVYVEGASINISCQTNGDLNAMECRWDIKEPTNPKFLSRWSDVPCDEMERRERAGEQLGKPGPVCTNQRSCRIRPVRMNCYRLWLQTDSTLGPINSSPIYVSALDHVKPHTASHIRAETHSSGLLSVSWTPPLLPVQGVRCRLRFHGPTIVGQPQWRVLPPVLEHQFEVPIADMCQSYAVQVSCQPIHGSGYWSDWSETVYSVQNSTAPERGPDFWRGLTNEISGGQTTVTLLFELLTTKPSGLPYCVDGLLIRHQPLDGAVREERIPLRSSHKFEWNQEVQTVSVMAYNQHGPSHNNFNMTLSPQGKRPVLRSFHVLLVNSSCVSVSWSVLDTASEPQYLILQWSPHSPREPGLHSSSPTSTWKRLRFTDRPVYISGEFGSEEYDFYLYPVFADGEGQPVHTRAVRREPGAYMLLMIVSFLSIVLLVTLALTQNQMKKIVWKEVPNPNKCSWAKGLDFRKVDTLEHLLRAPESVPAWPLLLPSENISTVVIMDKADLSSLTQPSFVSFTAEPSTTPTSSLLNVYPQDFQTPTGDNTDLFNEDPTPNQEIESLLQSDPQNLGIPKDNSAQSSVTYATVLLSDPKIKRLTDSSGCSSSDEGNFSANNSDISDSSHGALWELDSCRGGDLDQQDNRRSCSYNSVEELSESSDEPEDDDDDGKREKDLYYLKLNADESEEDQDESRDSLLKSIVLSKEGGSYPLLDTEHSNEQSVLLSAAPPCGLSPLYLPQYRTAPNMADLGKMTSDCESI